MQGTDFVDVVQHYVPYANTATAACIAAFAAFIVSLINNYVIRTERKAREQFETAERQAREGFESQRAAVQISSELSKEAWRRNIERLETASGQLSKTVIGVVMLIDEGPQINDFRMIKETAKVLDVFGDFQTSAAHFAIPHAIARQSEELITLITQILLTLHPRQAVRESPEHIVLLRPLKEKVKEMTDVFKKACREYEQRPQVLETVMGSSTSLPSAAACSINADANR